MDYEFICMNEFSSERKLMSVVVRDKVDGKLYVFAKGAETQIFERLTPESHASAMKTQIDAQVYNFGCQGLRTLVFAMREMTEEEFASIDWSNQANPVALSDACERDLTILACTGVEDELQDNVAECIRDFRAAGIKFWMLTGDLGHTAKEIAFNCGVMSRDNSVNSIVTLE